MSAITSELVKELRDRTGAGMMDCKAALKETGADMEKAIDFLRKKGAASASKRAGKEAKEGMVVARLLAPNKVVLIEANCETDFVAKTDDFKSLIDLALAEVSSHGEAALTSEKLNLRIAELSGKIGEKILVRRARRFESANGLFYIYSHHNQKLSAVVEVLASSKGSQLDELGKSLAMQVANSNPSSVDRSGVSSELVEREKAIYREEIKGKPENIVEKIILGKLDKFYQSQCLLEQPYIRDDKKTIKALLEEYAKMLGGTITVKSFVRYQLGESIQA